MQTRTFEETRPDDYLMRLAASDLGKAYKNLAVSEMTIRPGDVVVDLGCGPGADLPAFADATGGGGRVIGVDSDPDAVRQAQVRTASLPQVEVRESDVQFLDIPASSADRVHTDRVLQHVPDEAGFRVGKVIPITAVFRDAQAADQVLGLRRVTGRAVAAGFLTKDSADQWLDHLVTQPFFASTTLFILTATAA
jgi:ribosomal protein L11 methylase PrmA